MDQGCIKLWRRIKNWEWYRDSHTLHLFLHLLLSANQKDSRFFSYEIKRGDVVTGRLQLALETGLSQQVIRTSLKRLKSTSTITSKSTNKFTIITICNYETYQGEEKEINQVINQQPNQQLTSKQPATNQQTAIKKTENGVVERKKKVAQYESLLSFEEREKIFREAVFSVAQYPQDFLQGFFNYWSELATDGKMKFELQETWELKKRMSTWALKRKEFGKNGQGERKKLEYEQHSPGKYDNLPVSQISG